MKRVLNQQTFNAGISESEKEGLAGSSFFSKHLNIYQDPRYMELFPAPKKMSGSTVTDLVKWIVPATEYSTSTFFYDAAGNIYQQTLGEVWSLFRAVTSSVGQGMDVHQDYLYYTQNTQVGRYGPLSFNPAFTDNWKTGLTDTSGSAFAPVKAFKEGLAIGHGNNLAWWDGSVWTLSKILLPPGFNIRTLEIFNEYLVIGCWKGSAISDNEEGYMFFWDGTADTFNFFVTAQDGGVAAVLNSKNKLISFLGSDSTFYMDYSPFTKAQQMPKVTLSDSVDIYPGAVTNWRSLSFFGVAGNTDSTNLLRGVYAYGSRSSKYPDALSFAFSISTGSTGSSVKIGSIKGIGKYLYIGWQDGSSYGVDRVANNGPCFASGYFEQLLFDNGTLYREKRINRTKVTHLALLEGQGVMISTSLDREAYTDSAANTDVGDTETNYTPPLNRAKEIQNKVTVTSTSGFSPRITSLAMIFDDQKQEEQF